MLGAAQFGIGAAVAPLVGVLGNSEFALAVVMLVGSAVALAGLLTVSSRASRDIGTAAFADEAA